jgi:hypothetical protein
LIWRYFYISRPQRIEYQGAYYRALNRGNKAAKYRLFIDDGALNETLINFYSKERLAPDGAVSSAIYSVVKALQLDEELTSKVIGIINRLDS